MAGGALGNAAALLVVPEFGGATVRAASGHGWDDRGEKSEGDEKASDESHFEKRVGKRANRVVDGELLLLVLWLYRAWLVRHRDDTVSPDRVKRPFRFDREIVHPAHFL